MNPTPRIPFTRTNASVLLDLMRGLAALIVCFGHWRRLLFVDYHAIAAHRAYFAIPYLVAGAGHKAVLVFFVLSGYLISGSVFRLFEREQWSWRTYLAHRLVRLWIVLLPALLLGYALDFVGLHLRIAPALYAGETGTFMIGDVAASLHPSVFFGNLFFLQRILVSTLGSNGPLWSLSCEFWYYILFPCAFLALRRGTPPGIRALNAIAALCCAFFVGGKILALFPVWLLGTVLAAIPPARVGTGLRTAAAVGYILVFCFPEKIGMSAGLWFDYLVGAATFVFVWLLLGAGGEAPQKVWVGFSRGMARFSYTLYLVHVPLIVLLTGLIAGEQRLQPDARHLLYGFAALLLVIGYAYAVASFTEFRTDRVRGWVEAKVLGKTPRARESFAVKS